MNNDMQEGTTIWFYEDGKIKSELNYKNGNLNGHGMEYYQNGNVKAKQNFNYGYLKVKI